MTRTWKRAAVAAIFGVLATGAAAVLAMDQLPPVQRSGGVEYINGGVGIEQSRAIEQASAHWPLTITFAQQDHQHGDFVTDVKTVVRDAKGASVLTLDKAGPIVLAKLEPGDYTVEATRHGKTLSERVQVKAGTPTKTELMWPHEATQ
jgi:hypothetical protein